MALTADQARPRALRLLSTVRRPPRQPPPRRSSLIGMIGTDGNGAAGGTTEPAQSRSKSLKANRLRVAAAVGGSIGNFQ